MPLHRVTPRDVPSQTEIIVGSLAREAARLRITRYTGLEKGYILKDLAEIVEKDSVLSTSEYVVDFVTSLVAGMLGPACHDKMLTREIGAAPPTREVIVTNDASEFLSALEFSHPVARLMVDAAKSVDREVGDGVASTLVMAGALVKEASKLVRVGIHPSVIVEGYNRAMALALGVLEEISIDAGIGDDAVVEGVARTAIRGKGLEETEDHIARIVKNILQRLSSRSSASYINLDHVKVRRVSGCPMSETLFFNGVALRNEVVREDMPKKLRNARVALLSKPIVTRDMEKPISTEEVVFEFEERDAYTRYSDSRRRILSEMVEKVAATGADALFCSKGLDEPAINRLRQLRILTVRRIVPEDMERIALATGGKVVAYPSQLSSEVLGYAELIEEKKLGESKWVIIEGTTDASSLTVLLTAPSDEIARDAEYSFLNALRSAATLYQEPRVVPGGGVAHLEISIKLREAALSIGDKTSLAIESFARAMEEVPRTIIQNAGLDPIEALAEVKRLHLEGQRNAGVDAARREIVDVVERGILDPLSVARQSIISATGLATMIIKTDGIVYVPRTEWEVMERRKRERRKKGKRPGDWIEEKEY